VAGAVQRPGGVPPDVADADRLGVAADLDDERFLDGLDVDLVLVRAEHDRHSRRRAAVGDFHLVQLVGRLAVLLDGLVRHGQEGVGHLVHFLVGLVPDALHGRVDRLHRRVAAGPVDFGVVGREARQHDGAVADADDVELGQPRTARIEELG